MSNNFGKSEWTKYLLSLLVIAFIFSSISGILFMSNKYNIIIGKQRKVNINEFVNILNNEKRAMYSLKLTEEQLALLNSKEFMISILSKIMYSKLIDIEIENLGIQKPKDLVMDSILNDKYFHEDGKFKFEKFGEMLSKYSISEQDYIKVLQSSHNKKFLFDSLKSISNLNENSINIVMSEINTYKNIIIFSIEKWKLPSYKGKIEENEIEHYYNNNISRFVVPEKKEISYIKIVNYKDDQLEKIKTMKLNGSSLDDIAKTMNLKIEILGFISQDEVENNDNYKWMTNIYDLEKGKLSYIRKVDNDAYIYTVSNIEESKVKPFEEVKNEIISVIKDEKTADLHNSLVNKYSSEYINKNFDNNYLINLGFKSKKVNKFNYRISNYNEDFIRIVMNSSNGNITKVFIDDKNIYFAYTKSTGVLDRNNKNYISKDSITEEFVKYNEEIILESYMSYLKNNKYKMRINYKLLDLIK